MKKVMLESPNGYFHPAINRIWKEMWPESPSSKTIAGIIELWELYKDKPGVFTPYRESNH